METGAFDKDPVPSFDDLYWRFCETVHGLDENIGRVIKTLEPLEKDTVTLYMGDNGFALGEHGFYDKRDAFEVSIRVPMIAHAPGRIAPNTSISPMVQNIDLAPTLLDFAGVNVPDEAPKMDGRSFAPLLLGQTVPNWRKHILYEYHWEWNFPGHADPASPSERTVTNTSTITVSGIAMASMISKPTLTNATISSTFPPIRNKFKAYASNSSLNSRIRAE